MTGEVQTLDELATVVRGKMDSIEAQIGDTVDERLNTRMGDGEFKRSLEEMFKSYIESDSGKEHVRKVRWGSDPSDRELVGTKYARMGMSRTDVELLHNIMTAAQESGLNKRGPSEELTRTFEAISGGHYRSTALARADDERNLERMRRDGKLDHVGYERAIRAMDTAESGFGSQLIGAQYVGDLWEAARRQSRVFNLFDSFEMTEASTYIPVEVDIPEMLFVGESTAANSSDYTTSKTGSQRVQLTPKKFIIHQIYSGEMEEDAIVPYLPFLRRQAGLSMEHYSDSVVLNGDTTNAATGNINLDDADPADTKAYLALDGLRHAWIVDNTANGMNANGAVTWSQLNRVRTLMIDDTNIVDWGYPTLSGDLVYVADPRTCNYMSLMDEVLTVDKYGAGATVLTGELARIGPHPLICSQAMRLTEADGKPSTTGGNNTKGQVQVFNRNGFKVGWRRRVVMETERLPGRDQTRLVWSLRFDFARFSPTGAASGIEASAGIYNITLPS
jgi:HK97 family phage major capsid protein